MPSNPKNTVSTVIPGPRVRILLPPVGSHVRTSLGAMARVAGSVALRSHSGSSTAVGLRRAIFNAGFNPVAKCSPARRSLSPSLRRASSRSRLRCRLPQLSHRTR